MSQEVVEASGWLAALASLVVKLMGWLLPSAVGAAIMCAVDKPATNKEMFLRAFVAFGFTYLFRGVLITIASKYMPGFDPTVEEHRIAVYGTCGATGWFVMGAVATFLRKLREDPWSVLPAFMQPKKPSQ